MSLNAAPCAAASTRQRILDVALELFAAHGFAATTTRELSERLGFTKAALYYHFHTKDDLLQALVEPVLDELNRVLAGHAVQPVDDAVRASALAGYLDVVLEHRRLLGVLVQDPSATGRPAMEAGREFYLQLTTLLAGPAGDSPQARARVRFVLGGVHGTVLFAEPDDDPAVLRASTLTAARAALGLEPARTDR